MYSTVVWTNFWCLQHSSHNPRNYPFPSLLSFPSLHTPIQCQYQTVTQHRILWAKILKNSGIQGNCTTINSKGLNQGRVKQGYEANKKNSKRSLFIVIFSPFLAHYASQQSSLKLLLLLETTIPSSMSPSLYH